MAQRPPKKSADTDGAPANCALCHRPLGKRVEMHHLVPKSLGGRAVVPLHPICHRMIHKTFRERELARHFSTPEQLRADERIATFIKWLEGKPPDFYRRTYARRQR